MYRAIARNRRSSIFLIAVFVVIICAAAVAVSFAVESWWPAVLILLFTGLYTWWQIATAMKNAAKIAGCVEVTAKDEPRLYRTVENLAIRLGMPTPTVAVIEDPAPNALALGMKEDSALVAATRGLLDMLEDSELEGVMAHEMAHIKNEDSRVKLTIFAIIGSVAALSYILARGAWAIMRHPGRGKGAVAVLAFGLALLAVAGLFALIAFLIGPLVNAAVSREREFLADASAFEMTRFADGLASALQKMDASAVTGKAALGTHSFYFLNPARRSRFASWFSSHPSTEKRVERLRSISRTF